MEDSGKITDIRQVNGVNKETGKSWVMHVLQLDGDVKREYTAFKQFPKTLEEAMTAGKTVIVSFDAKGEYKNYSDFKIKEYDAQNPPVVKPFPKEKPPSEEAQPDSEEEQDTPNEQEAALKSILVESCLEVKTIQEKAIALTVDNLASAKQTVDGNGLARLVNCAYLGIEGRMAKKLREK